jgi:hypothetical protein
LEFVEVRAVVQFIIRPQNPFTRSEFLEVVQQWARSLASNDLVAGEKVLTTLDTYLASVDFVENGWVVKTSSGKVSRAANKDKYPE